MPVLHTAVRCCLFIHASKLRIIAGVQTLRVWAHERCLNDVLYGREGARVTVTTDSSSQNRCFQLQLCAIAWSMGQVSVSGRASHSQVVRLSVASFVTGLMTGIVSGVFRVSLFVADHLRSAFVAWARAWPYI